MAVDVDADMVNVDIDEDMFTDADAEDMVRNADMEKYLNFIMDGNTKVIVMGGK